MSDNKIYENNPLHGLSLENLLIELVNQYGFALLDAYLNVNCFKKNASIESSIKFLKKTDWAREKVEAFYLYKFKNLPKAPASELDIPPRDRIVPLDQQPGEPAELSFEDAERIQKNRAKMAAEFNRGGRSAHRHPGSKPRSTSHWEKPKPKRESNDRKESDGPVEPWSGWKKK